MEIDRKRPVPEGDLGAGRATAPRQAASVILLRGGADRLELLLVRRSPAQRFMGGVWVFPGGAVDAHEGEGDPAHRAAAVRELREEAGVGVRAGELVKFSRWITPPEVPTRFDTHFFLACAPAGVRPRCDGLECVDLRWSSPRAALDAHGAGDLDLVFPTIKQLEQLSAFGSAGELLEHARGREVVAVRPRVVHSGEQARVVLPGETGYDDG